MARVTFGFGIARISGKIGGSVFSGSRYANILKSTPRKTKAVSPYQQEHGIFINIIVSEWSKLTDSQRYEWETFAEYYGQLCAHNPSRRLNGYNVFIALNLNRFLIGESIMRTAPWTGKHFTLSDVDHFASVDLLRIFYLPHIDTRYFRPACWFTFPLSPGVSNADKFYRYLDPDEVSESYASYYQSYRRRFGINLIRGMRVFYYLEIIHRASGFPSNGIEKTFVFQ